MDNMKFFRKKTSHSSQNSSTSIDNPKFFKTLKNSLKKYPGISYSKEKPSAIEEGKMYAYKDQPVMKLVYKINEDIQVFNLKLIDENQYIISRNDTSVTKNRLEDAISYIKNDMTHRQFIEYFKKLDLKFERIVPKEEAPNINDEINYSIQLNISQKAVNVKIIDGKFEVIIDNKITIKMDTLLALHERLNVANNIADGHVFFSNFTTQIQNSNSIFNFQQRIFSDVSSRFGEQKIVTCKASQTDKNTLKEKNDFLRNCNEIYAVYYKTVSGENMIYLAVNINKWPAICTITPDKFLIQEFNNLQEFTDTINNLILPYSRKRLETSDCFQKEGLGKLGACPYLQYATSDDVSLLKEVSKEKILFVYKITYQNFEQPTSTIEEVLVGICSNISWSYILLFNPKKSTQKSISANSLDQVVQYIPQALALYKRHKIAETKFFHLNAVFNSMTLSQCYELIRKNNNPGKSAVTFPLYSPTEQELNQIGVKLKPQRLYYICLHKRPSEASEAPKTLIAIDPYQAPYIYSISFIDTQIPALSLRSLEEVLNAIKSWVNSSNNTWQEYYSAQLLTHPFGKFNQLSNLNNEIIYQLFFSYYPATITPQIMVTIHQVELGKFPFSLQYNSEQPLTFNTTHELFLAISSQLRQDLLKFLNEKIQPLDKKANLSSENHLTITLEDQNNKSVENSNTTIDIEIINENHFQLTMNNTEPKKPTIGTNPIEIVNIAWHLIANYNLQKKITTLGFELKPLEPTVIQELNWAIDPLISYFHLAGNNKINSNLSTLSISVIGNQHIFNLFTSNENKNQEYKNLDDLLKVISDTLLPLSTQQSTKQQTSSHVNLSSNHQQFNNSQHLPKQLPVQQEQGENFEMTSKT